MFQPISASMSKSKHELARGPNNDDLVAGKADIRTAGENKPRPRPPPLRIGGNWTPNGKLGGEERQTRANSGTIREKARKWTKLSGAARRPARRSRAHAPVLLALEADDRPPSKRYLATECQRGPSPRPAHAAPSVTCRDHRGSRGSPWRPADTPDRSCGGA